MVQMKRAPAIPRIELGAVIVGKTKMTSALDPFALMQTLPGTTGGLPGIPE